MMGSGQGAMVLRALGRGWGCRAMGRDPPAAVALAVMWCTAGHSHQANRAVRSGTDARS